MNEYTLNSKSNFDTLVVTMRAAFSRHRIVFDRVMYKSSTLDGIRVVGAGPGG